MDMTMVWTYAAYLVLSLGLTVFVARTLHKNGRIFLVDSFGGNEKMADSVNHLLVVGFYLINIGFVSLALKYGAPAKNLQESVEYLSWKIGIVALVLGGMHFTNLLVFSLLRRKTTERAEWKSRWDNLPEVKAVELGHR
jgi:hypothetical protein